jgi:hypothetical protein
LEERRGLLSFGSGKKVIFKRLSHVETGWEKIGVGKSLDAASIGLQIPIVDKVTLKIA